MMAGDITPKQLYEHITGCKIIDPPSEQCIKWGEARAVELIVEENSALRAEVEANKEIREAEKLILKHSTKKIRLLFTHPPGPDSSFVEAEDEHGKSIRAGEWFE